MYWKLPRNISEYETLHAANYQEFILCHWSALFGNLRDDKFKEIRSTHRRFYCSWPTINGNFIGNKRNKRKREEREKDRENGECKKREGKNAMPNIKYWKHWFMSPIQMNTHQRDKEPIPYRRWTVLKRYITYDLYSIWDTLCCHLHSIFPIQCWNNNEAPPSTQFFCFFLFLFEWNSHKFEQIVHKTIQRIQCVRN